MSDVREMKIEALQVLLEAYEKQFGMLREKKRVSISKLIEQSKDRRWTNGEGRIEMICGNAKFVFDATIMETSYEYFEVEPQVILVTEEAIKILLITKMINVGAGKRKKQIEGSIEEVEKAFNEIEAENVFVKYFEKN